MKLAHALLLLAVLAFGTGCKSGHSMVGKWSTTIANQPFTFEFTSDGKVTSSLQQNAGPVGMVDASISGTYKYEGDDLATSIAEVSAKARDASQQALVDQYIASTKDRQVETLRKLLSGKTVWKSEDEIEVTEADGKKQTFTRVKG